MRKRPTRIPKKRGAAYEIVVSEVIAAFDPNAEVKRGEWLVGPDGRRDSDVVVCGTLNGRQVMTYIECKDFRGSPRRKVGISYVDALDSKRNDVGADFAILCSNSGFTDKAVRKAKRCKIGLISVLRAKDDRVRMEIWENIYVRHIKLEALKFSGTVAEPLEEEPADLSLPLLYDGHSIADWVNSRANFLGVSRPLVDGLMVAQLRLKRPTPFRCGNSTLMMQKFEISLERTTKWSRQTKRIDSSNGIYDWLTGRLTIGGQQANITIKNVDFDCVTECDPPSDPSELLFGFGLGDGAAGLAIIVLDKSFKAPLSLDRNLDDLFVEEDIRALTSGVLDGVNQSVRQLAATAEKFIGSERVK